MDSEEGEEENMNPEEKKEYEKIAEEVIRMLDGKRASMARRLSLLLLGLSLEVMSIPRDEIEKFFKLLSDEFLRTAMNGNDKIAEVLRKQAEDILKGEV